MNFILHILFFLLNFPCGASINVTSTVQEFVFCQFINNSHTVYMLNPVHFVFSDSAVLELRRQFTVHSRYWKEDSHSS
uniref:Putative secreted protein n=1 Tax=Ixodes ricinus TaxID=34613 RepID=A0A6B0U5C4_IXORI